MRARERRDGLPRPRAAPSLDLPDVSEILRPRHSALVREEVFDADERRLPAGKVDRHPAEPGLFEGNTGELLKKVHARGGAPEPHDLVGSRAAQLAHEDLGHSEAEEGVARARDVLRCGVEPQVEVLRRSRARVERDGVPAHDQETHAGRRERTEKLDQIGG